MEDLNGDLLRRTRIRHGLSQERLARRAGTTQAAVSRIERGLVSPSVETLGRLLGAMGWELDIGLRRSRWQDHDPAALRRFGAQQPRERLAGIELAMRDVSQLQAHATNRSRS